MTAWNLLPKKICKRDSKEIFNNGSYKKERIILQTLTKLPILGWYREEEINSQTQGKIPIH